MPKKSGFLFLLIFVSVLAFASGRKESIVIGGIFPLTGDVSVYGLETRRGIDLAIEEINAAGGIDGKKLVLEARDDGGISEKTVSAFKRLTARGKVGIIIGSLTSACTAAISPLAQAQQVLLLAPAATEESITAAGDYVFRACFIDSFQGTAGGYFAARDLGAKRAAVLYNRGSEYSMDLLETFTASFLAEEGVLAASESYAPGDTNFASQLEKIKAASPDVIYLPEYYNTAALIIRQIRAMGITVPLVGADGWDGLTAAAGDEILNGFYSSHYASDSRDLIVTNFVNAFRVKYGSLPSSFAALGYDSLYIIRDAIARAGSDESAAVRDSLAGTGGVYVTGPISFDERRNPVKSAVFMEFVNFSGSLIPVYKATVNP